MARIALLEADGHKRDEIIGLLQEKNRWLKNQLFNRSSEKPPAENLSPDQARLFNEAEALQPWAVKAALKPDTPSAV